LALRRAKQFLAGGCGEVDLDWRRRGFDCRGEGSRRGDSIGEHLLVGRAVRDAFNGRERAAHGRAKLACVSRRRTENIDEDVSMTPGQPEAREACGDDRDARAVGNHRARLEVGWRR
jgi:hypothetical protein